MPKWRNWQTRCVQGAVGAILWGFKSPLRQNIRYAPVCSKIFLLTFVIYFGNLLAGYHTIETSEQELTELNTIYPNITSLESLGVSTQDRITLWGFKISDNPTEMEDEPSVLITGAIHAEELVGVEVCHYAINKLLTGYTNDSLLTYLIDNLQIYFIPIVNPEGHSVVTSGLDITYRKNKRDNNANGIFDFTPGDGGDIDGVDLNRNFPFNWEGGDSQWISTSYRGPYPGSENEIQSIMRLAENYRFVEALFYHSSRSGRYNEWVIYPWIWGGIQSPDFPVISDIARTLASRLVSLRGGNYQAWYSISRNGNANDWFYSQLGTICLTVEVDTTTQPDTTRLYSVCENQWNGIKYILERALQSGITVYVYDSLTGGPLSAEVKVTEAYDSILAPRITDERFGVHRRLLLPGTYHIIISSSGYRPETLAVSVCAERPTIIRANLVPLTPGISQAENDRESILFYSTGKMLYFKPDTCYREITLFNIAGKKVFEHRVNGHSCTISLEVPSGIYIARITGGNKKQVRKIVVLQ